MENCLNKADETIEVSVFTGWMNGKLNYNNYKIAPNDNSQEFLGEDNVKLQTVEVQIKNRKYHVPIGGQIVFYDKKGEKYTTSPIQEDGYVLSKNSCGRTYKMNIDNFIKNEKIIKKLTLERDEFVKKHEFKELKYYQGSKKFFPVFTSECFESTESFPILGTYGASVCGIICVYSKKDSKAIMLHFPDLNKINKLKEKIYSMNKPLIGYFLGCKNNPSNQITGFSLMKEFKEKGIKVLVYDNQEKESDSFLIDSRNGKTYFINIEKLREQQYSRVEENFSMSTTLSLSLAASVNIEKPSWNLIKNDYSLTLNQYNDTFSSEPYYEKKMLEQQLAQNEKQNQLSKQPPKSQKLLQGQPNQEQINYHQRSFNSQQPNQNQSQLKRLII